MARYICKFQDHDRAYYLEWSTVVDAPVTPGMTMEEFTEYYEDRYDTSGVMGLEDRLKRVEAKGTSAMMYDSLTELIQRNRAGKNEACLTMEEIMDRYCRDSFRIGDKKGGLMDDE